MVGCRRGLHTLVACLLALHIVQATLSPEQKLEQKRATKVVTDAVKEIASGNLQVRTKAGKSWMADCLLAKDKEELSTLKLQYEAAGNTGDWYPWVTDTLQNFKKTKIGREHVAKFNKEAADKLGAAAVIKKRQGQMWENGGGRDKDKDALWRKSPEGMESVKQAQCRTAAKSAGTKWSIPDHIAKLTDEELAKRLRAFEWTYIDSHGQPQTRTIGSCTYPPCPASIRLGEKSGKSVLKALDWVFSQLDLFACDDCTGIGAMDNEFRSGKRMKGLKMVDAEVTQLGFATLRQFFQFAESSLKSVAEIAATACWETIVEHNGRRAGEFGLDTGQLVKFCDGCDEQPRFSLPGGTIINMLRLLWALIPRGAGFSCALGVVAGQFLGPTAVLAVLSAHTACWDAWMTIKCYYKLLLLIAQVLGATAEELSGYTAMDTDSMPGAATVLAAGQLDQNKRQKM